jgi:predicted aspartyl protease
MAGGVGHIYASVKVYRDPAGPWRELRVLIDTGATLSVIPGEVLASLGIPSLRTESFELADGRTIHRQVGGAFLAMADRVAPTLVAFGEAADAPILGVIALEELGLEVDARSGELRPAKRLLVAARCAAAAA